MNNTVSWLGLAVSLSLVAVAAGISWWQRLGLQRQILIAAARALAQLLLVGVALTLVISPGRPIWWSWLWVAAMLGYAATVARRRAPEVPHLLPLALASFTAAAVVTLGVLFGLHVFPLTGRTLVPIAGMMVGNSMTATVLAEQHTQSDHRGRGEGGQRQGQQVRDLRGAAAGDHRRVAEHRGDPQPGPPDRPARAEDQGKREANQQQLGQRAGGGGEDLALQAQALPPGDPGGDGHQQQRHGQASPADGTVHGLTLSAGMPVRCPSRNW